jgi:carboxypeptidase family protein/TonB-dependent receptor-like protein
MRRSWVCAALGLAVAAGAARAQSCIDGRVLAADADRPIAGATVSATWTEIQTGKKKGPAEIRVSRDTTTDATGHYHACVTLGASALIQVKYGQAYAYFPIAFAGSTNPPVDLRVSAHDEGEHATVSGKVVSETGDPVKQATITVLGSDASAQTSDHGDFEIRDLPTGSQILIARSVGRDAQVVATDLTATKTTTVSVTMQQLPPTLEVVNIVADRTRLSTVYKDIGFTQRQRIGNGKFMTEAQIEARGVNDVPELFRGMPGVRVVDDHYGVLKVYSNRGPSTIYDYGDCTAYVVDGTLIGNGRSMDLPLPSTNEPWGGPDELMLPAPEDLIAVEVYQPNEPAPTPLSGPAVRCLKVLLWTKAMLERSK